MVGLVKLVLAMVLLATIMGREPMAMAIGYGGSSETICGISPDTLMLCKSAVRGPDALPPTQGCCDALSNSKIDGECLCSYLKKPKLLQYFGVDPKQATQLAGKCNLPVQSIPCA
ncbi:putative lipid-transfer protein DIR1 [Impatiens glandulifera]|uniref:putative lipid-transfer protein DIR1 n=1 Tax=Impatiens glandulifera TaxID=253017 RepID=UPI001FB130FD|nr:putative lipid-transfer protein DIR1 [Impatiens glandulifera]